jgi:hypothetical protein
MRAGKMIYQHAIYRTYIKYDKNYWYRFKFKTNEKIICVLSGDKKSLINIHYEKLCKIILFDARGGKIIDMLPKCNSKIW